MSLFEGWKEVEDRRAEVSAWLVILAIFGTIFIAGVIAGFTGGFIVRGLIR